MKNKLELTWVGKDEEIKVEPRILIEDPSHSNTELDPDTQNLLIHGDNLLALKALEAKFAGQVKCIYIDPPYNISATGVPFDDNVEHSQWLNLMKVRIEIMYKLLSQDGLLVAQIDDENYAYLYLLIADYFGKRNIKSICVKMSEATGVKMASVKKAGSIAKRKEYLIIAKINGIKGLKMETVPKDKWDSEYKTVVTGLTREELEALKNILNDEDRTEEDILRADELLAKVTFKKLKDAYKEETGKNAPDDDWLYSNAFRIVQIATLTGGARELAIKKKQSLENYNHAFSIVTAQGKMYAIKSNFNTETKL